MLTQTSKLILIFIISIYLSNNVLAETLAEKANFPLSLLNINPDYTAEVSPVHLLIADSQTENSDNDPSPMIIDRVKENLVERLNIKKEEIKVKTKKSQSWSDGCLELGKVDEFCTQVIVEGWQIILEDPQKNIWIYHTNRDGSVIRLKENM